MRHGRKLSTLKGLVLSSAGDHDEDACYERLPLPSGTGAISKANLDLSPPANG